MAKPVKEFEIEDIVFLKTDPEQNPRMVVSIVVYKTHLEYNLSFNGEILPHFGFEISKSKTIMLPTD
jgi:hypothetical protein